MAIIVSILSPAGPVKSVLPNGREWRSRKQRAESVICFVVLGFSVSAKGRRDVLEPYLLGTVYSKQLFAFCSGLIVVIAAMVLAHE
jgi:hypothetical protein